MLFSDVFIALRCRRCKTCSATGLAEIGGQSK